jgi:Fanconi anemia group M protein
MPLQTMMVKPLLRDVTPRLYQEAIFAKASQANTLVVLPTGLGKTLVALLLTAQRLTLYPASKVLLLAPTKPLVQQHEQTFRKHLDLPSDAITAFTGEITPEKRRTAWNTARVILSTPQALENDLLTRRVLLDDVSLLIIDEAHRATGDYAYVFVAQQYVTYSKLQRVLALTASPGSDEPSIDEIIRNLHIEQIEVRTPDDADVKEYVHETDIEYITTPLPPAIKNVKKALEKTHNEKLHQLRLLGFTDVDSKVQLLALQSQLHGQIASGEKDFGTLKAISVAAEALKVAHALELVETQGIEPLQAYLRELVQQGESGKSKAAINLVNDPNFKYARHLVAETLENSIDHPKLERVRTILTALRQGEKAIIFASYRSTGISIKKTLDAIGVDSRVFVGQAKKGESGMSQKEQKETVAQFRDGMFPVLIATSVGEEGLDIPTVDLVLFYEPVPSGIRTIQRRGRTARHSTGRVIVLISEGTRDVIYRWSSHHKEKRMFRVLEGYRAKLLPKGPQTTLPSMTSSVKADFREKGTGVIKELIDLGVQPVLEHLPVADYVLSGRVAIELKTVPDFVDSIIDGRLLEQLRSLRQYEAPLLVIQGQEDVYSVRNIHPNAIRGMFGAITTAYRIPVLWTRNAKDTAALIAVLVKREQDEDTAGPAHAKPKTEREQQEAIVAMLPGIGSTLAKPLLEHFGSVEAVICATRDELIRVPLIGNKKADAIRSIVEKRYEKD